jgi:hypothetical protein
MSACKTIRAWAVAAAIVALLVFSTTVVSDWDCRTAADDIRCPYCHLSHQAPAPDIQFARIVIALQPVDSVPLPEDEFPVTRLQFTNISPRAPPAS